MYNDNEADFSDKEEISKTKIKAHMEELQDLGMALAKLSKSQLEKFELPDTLREALKSAKTINSNRALKRNNQYIGKLMRSVDEAYIRQRLSFVMGDSAVGARILHDCEAWRDKLIESDTALDDFIAKYPDCDITELRQLVRIIRKEIQLSQNKNYRKLFQFIRQYIKE
ncbi:MAG: DUF615 domain-containing protein [Proteobacteria bacterium]|jgi:ribosome-associated protein|nr:DUF615 domain-containing protein [Pseudomonadota bacterium]